MTKRTVVKADNNVANSRSFEDSPSSSTFHGTINVAEFTTTRNAKN